jgi:hypothetical protein
VLRTRRERRHLERYGYVRMGSLLGGSELDALRDLAAEVIDRVEGGLGSAWFPTGLLPDADLRDRVSAVASEVLRSRILPLFQEGTAELVRADLSIKPASPDSALGPHQDYSIVDERRHRSLYFWIPLVDVDARNGTMHVVPGSHRFGNDVRARSVPAKFSSLEDLIEAHAVEIRASAGELLITDGAVVHFSPPNRGSATRVAVHGILKPSAAPLVYFFRDDSTPEGFAEMYEVSIDEYLSATHSGRPGSACLGLRELPPTEMDAGRFLAGLERAGTRRSPVRVRSEFSRTARR